MQGLVDVRHFAGHRSAPVDHPVLPREAAHRPLGAINRACREVYEYSAGYRGDFNGCPMHQVKELADLET